MPTVEETIACITNHLEKVIESAAQSHTEQVESKKLADNTDQGGGQTARGHNAGLDRALELYTRCWIHTDQIVNIAEMTVNQPTCEDGCAKSELTACRITGLDEYGYLQASELTPPFKVYSLHPDGNSFDLMRGLIVSKKK
ncbi:unnamed protein product [Protopolystoma xenopodis]|uniref:Uncharacterized protein n=1 Tax=Protopolystoma xenopodis TaxID=117903 RepID=A0A448WZG5_9PLAT|nr:unnamed protein product [Protopolystoma xenopodis]